VDRPNSLPDYPGLNNQTFQNRQEERFVDADAAAAFLSLSRKHVLKLARLGRIPAYPITFASRAVWRFRISELENWMLGGSHGIGDNGVGDSQKGRA
jgi:predicted DNA-binding transcriptional regulator AlpA